MKKLICLLICFLLGSTVYTGFGAESDFSIQTAKIQFEKFELFGTAPIPNSTITLIVGKPGVNLHSATPADLIYTNVSKTDNSGSFRFAFPVYELRGDFEYSLTAVGVLPYYGIISYDPTGDNTIKDFKVGGVSCTIAGNNISVTLPASSNLTGLIAEFSVHKDAHVFVGDKLQSSGLSRNNFTNPVKYTVVADDSSIKEYLVIVTRKSDTTGGAGGGSSKGSSFTAPIQINPPETIEQVGFLDVPKTHWAYEDIQKLSKAKILTGFPDGSFAPEQFIKREEFVKILTVAFSIKEKGVKEFSDVSPSDWYYPYVAAAYSNNLVKGISEDSFGVGRNITREDLAVILYRFLLENGKELSLTQAAKVFTDQDTISDYATKAVEQLQKAGLINGFADGSFGGKKPATRAEVCALISKLLS